MQTYEQALVSPLFFNATIEFVVRDRVIHAALLHFNLELPHTKSFSFVVPPGLGIEAFDDSGLIYGVESIHFLECGSVKVAILFTDNSWPYGRKQINFLEEMWWLSRRGVRVNEAQCDYPLIAARLNEMVLELSELESVAGIDAFKYYGFLF